MMSLRRSAILAAMCLLPAACRAPAPAAGGPVAEDPALRTETDLRAERAARIEAGEVIEAEPQEPPAAPAGPPVARGAAARPGPNAVAADILLVNDAVLSSAEVLYPLRGAIAKAREGGPAPQFIEQLRGMVRMEVQASVGRILLHARALRELSEDQKRRVEAYVTREVDQRVARDFGGSPARLEQHLRENGLTLAQYKKLVERDVVVRQYARDEFMPRVRIGRAELQEYYEANADKFSTPETRELLLIEAPFSAFAPTGAEAGAPNADALARLRAVRHIRAAHAALATRPFEDVAREYSRGPSAERGGVFGMIGKPLLPPYDEATARIFTWSSGQTSEPIETAEGWCIVKCGRIVPAERKSFAHVQQQLRDELTERRFGELTQEYVMQMAEKAALSAVDPFIAETLRRAER